MTHHCLAECLIIPAAQVDDHFKSTHARLGGLFALCFLFQPLMAAFRPPRATPQRFAKWSAMHKGFGAVLLLLGYQLVLLGAGESGGGAALLAPLFFLLLLSIGIVGALEWRKRRMSADEEWTHAELKRLPQDEAPPAPQEALPDGWRECRDPNSSRLYYISPEGAAQWCARWPRHPACVLLSPDARRSAPTGMLLPPPPQASVFLSKAMLLSSLSMWPR